MIPYINAARQVVMDTCHLVLVFVTILVLVDILGSVNWIYLKRYVSKYHNVQHNARSSASHSQLGHLRQHFQEGKIEHFI